jgi:hypothetical protein
LFAHLSSYQTWLGYLPSDAHCEAFFNKHKVELTAIVTLAEREPTKIGLISADSPDTENDPDRVTCAKLLKKLGAQFLRQTDGAIEIYIWGDGCAICHDSYKGYAYIVPEARMLKYATVVRSLEDKALPKGKYAFIEDGSYICPLIDKWHLIRWECG